jgi:hypothetical protein
MAEMISPYNASLSHGGRRVGFGKPVRPCHQGKELTRQAAMIGDLNAFMMYDVYRGLGFRLGSDAGGAAQ